jgi:4-amino-4-deoxy-L-arabinose transferase-like glycosyltransferase
MTGFSTTKSTPSEEHSARAHSENKYEVKFWQVILAGFLFRIAGIFLFHTYRIDLAKDESANIAASLAAGHGFGNPFGGQTGPTAWLGPVYPFLLSFVFRVFGTFTRASVLAALTVNSFISALTAIPVYVIARKTFNLKVVWWSAWLWALFPYTAYWGIRWVWDTSLSALLFTLVFMMTLILAESGTLAKWLLYGVLWGIAGLTNTAELAFLPCAAIWLLYKQSHRDRIFWRNAILAIVVFIATLTPWTIRNYQVFHKFMPVRGNFGVEFHLGNTSDAEGLWQFWLHPSQDPNQFKLYKEMGEVAYAKSKLNQTLRFIHQNPEHFAFLTTAHFVYYWAGVPHAEKYVWIYLLKSSMFLATTLLAIFGIAQALRKRRHGAVLYLLLMLSYPTIYYITFAHPRYRHPIEPEILILSVYIFTEADKRSSSRAIQSTNL